jgi:hypothetical protein
MLFRRALAAAILVVGGGGGDTNAAYIARDVDRSYALEGDTRSGATSVADVVRGYKPDGRVIFGGTTTRRDRVLGTGVEGNVRDESGGKFHRATTGSTNGTMMTLVIGGSKASYHRDYVVSAAQVFFSLVYYIYQVGWTLPQHIYV